MTTQNIASHLLLPLSTHSFTRHFQGGDSGVKEAALQYKELEDRFGTLDASGDGSSSASAQNGYAAALIALHRLEDAERVLLEVLKASAGGPDDADTCINCIALYSHMGRPGKVDEFTARLRAAAPKHTYVAALDIAAGQFERVAASYAH
jgi:hypothetical protein